MALVDYDSSSSKSSSSTEDESLHVDQDAVVYTHPPLVRKSPVKSNSPQPPLKRPRKLPSLPSSFESGPKDDPTLHQGRTRTRPYVDGDYNAHVYLSLTLPPALRATLEELLATLKLELQGYTVHSSLESLHISLTHPLPFRRNHIVPFRNKLSTQLRGHGPFRLSLIGDVKVYYNRSQMQAMGDGDDAPAVTGGRAFFALRTGAGSDELMTMLDDIIRPILEMMHLPTYHENPEFHTSFGWCLLNPLNPSRSQLSDEALMDDNDADSPGPRADDAGLGKKVNVTTLPLTDEALAEANARFREKVLALQPNGGWEVDCVRFKAGKEVFILPLQ
ncbi:hypothetical protein IAT40_001725 [Kwoniella sp. CBS 6097]